MWSPFITGLVLAIVSSLFIGLSFIFKKIGLKRLAIRGLRAGRGGFGYLRDWVWWMGLFFMAFGELLNFTAYAFAPASLVTPLGALSVLVSTIAAHKYLQENLNVFSKLGCLLCIIGSTMIVLHAPKEGVIDTLDEIAYMLTKRTFLIYFLFVVLTSTFLIMFTAPKYGHTNVLIYVFICSIVGSLSVITCKSIGMGLRQTFNGDNQLTNPLFWFLLVSVIFTISIQMNYLNKALDIFDTSTVTPVYYVLFTSFVLIASSILYEEWNKMTFENILGDFCGFATVIIGIFMINAFKDLKLNMSAIKHQIVRANSQNKYLSQIALDNPAFTADMEKGVQWTHNDEL